MEIGNRFSSRKGLKKQLLSICVFSSLFLHALSLLFLQRHSLWFSTPSKALASLSWQAIPRGEILKETFLALSKESSQGIQRPSKIKSEEHLIQQFPFQQVQPNLADLLVFQPQPPFHPTDLLASNTTRPTLLAPQLSPLELFSSDLILPTFAAPIVFHPPLALPPQHPEPLLTLEKQDLPQFEAPKETLIAYENRGLDTPALADETAPARASLSIPAPPLPTFPTLDELETSSYSDSFDIELVCLPKQDESGYLFALTLIPHPDLKLPKIQQHYSFLIDRSNSIQRERLLATKNAVLKALEELAPEDTFNVFVFDSKVEKLFSSPKSVTAATLAQAKSFLNDISLGSFFTPAELYNPLAMILPSRVADDELYTAILMTDGENFGKKNSLHAILQSWTYQNAGRVALFTIGMGSDYQLAALDVASVFNKGRLSYSPTKRGLKRKMLKLMKNIHAPLAKNIACKAISKSSKTAIQLYPRPQQTPHLYLDQPFVILGSTESMDDFILFVQGRLKDRWLNIKKHISFVHAKKGGASLKQEWALQQAYECYERYLFDDNPDHLAEARSLLLPFDIQPAFQ